MLPPPLPSEVFPRMTPVEIDGFFSTLAAITPEPQTELNFSNAYTLLVAVVLSAQATDVSVNKATRHLFTVADTPEKMLALGEETLRDRLKTIGLFKAKTRNILALSQLLLEKFGGAVPGDREALESLPGVGRKTANVVLNVYFGEPTMAVDTHIFRLSNRTGLAPGKTPLAVERELLLRIPPQWLRQAHHWLILHGRYVCKARKPDCSHCQVTKFCHYDKKILS